MKKIIQFFFVLSTTFCFSQTTELEFDKMVESESKSAASTMNVQVNPNTQNYDVTYHELRFTVNPNNTPAAISGVVKTTFTALANMNTITFDMATELVVSSVTMNSANLLNGVLDILCNPHRYFYLRNRKLVLVVIWHLFLCKQGNLRQ